MNLRPIQRQARGTHICFPVLDPGAGKLKPALVPLLVGQCSARGALLQPPSLGSLDDRRRRGLPGHRAAGCRACHHADAGRSTGFAGDPTAPRAPRGSFQCKHEQIRAFDIGADSLTAKRTALPPNAGWRRRRQWRRSQTWPVSCCTTASGRRRNAISVTKVSRVPTDANADVPPRRSQPHGSPCRHAAGATMVQLKAQKAKAVCGHSLASR